MDGTITRFYFKLHNPSQVNREEYIEAKNKTEARKLIAQDYRANTPPASAGFYSFSQCRIEWTRQEEVAYDTAHPTYYGG